MFILSLLPLLFALPASASTDNELRILTHKDLYALAQKLEKALLKCKQLKERPAISVEITNDTDELVDKSELRGLVQSMLEERTPLHPEAEVPVYELHATLSNTRRKISLIEKSTYILTADLSQADEVLCKKTVKITKRSRLGMEKE